jgi:hypothetical protein
MKWDAPRSSTTAKMWHDDGVWGKTRIKFEQCIKYLYNDSNKQYASLPAAEEFGEVMDLKVAEVEELDSSSNVGSFVS